MNLTRWEPFKEADDFFRDFAPGLLGRWRLPENADAANVRAGSKDGVLNVHMPKVKAEPKKAVEIKVQ
jgi:HSP20 family molecular chaperone IbpA